MNTKLVTYISTSEAIIHYVGNHGVNGLEYKKSSSHLTYKINTYLRTLFIQGTQKTTIMTETIPRNHSWK